MKSSTWQELLTELVGATRVRRVTWEPTDTAGAYIAAFGSGSVLVRGIPQSAASDQITIMLPGGPAVEILDETGNQVAVLGSGMSVLRFGSSIQNDDLFTQASETHRRTIDELVTAILQNHGQGEQTALDIINELRLDRS